MIKFIEERREWTESISINILFEGGLLYEIKENNGISNLFSRVYQKSHELMEKAEFYGAVVTFSVNKNFIHLSFSTPSNVVGYLLDDFIEIILNPKFDKKIFKREKELLLKEITASNDLPNYLTKKGFYSISYKGTPYEFTEVGNKDSIKDFTFSDIEAYSQRILKQAGTVVSITGAYDDNIVSKLKSSLFKLPIGSITGYNFKDKLIIEADRHLEEEDTRLKQSKLLIAYTAPSPNDELFFATKVLEDIMGGGMSSRYFTEIRKNSGYAYAVSSNFVSLMPLSRYNISMGLDYENISSALEKLDAIHKELPKTLTNSDLEKSKNSIVAVILNSMQSNNGLGFLRALASFNGNEASFYQKEYLERIKMIRKDDILLASKILFQPRAIYIRKPKAKKKIAKFSLKNKKDQTILTSEEK